MNSEDDTFRALKKVPFDVVMRKVVETMRNPRPFPYSEQDLVALLDKHGWTYDEYEAESNARARAWGESVLMQDLQR